jgi:hypothetical protein
MLAQKLSRRGIFVGGEMLGLASIPYLQSVLGGSLAKSTAAAAVGINGGRDVTAIVSTQVMSLVRGASYAAIISKIKFLVVAIVMFSTLAAGAAQTVHTLVTKKFDWPKINFDISEWIKPMFKTGVTAPKLTADATTIEDPIDLTGNRSFAINFNGDVPRATVATLGRDWTTQHMQSPRPMARGSVVLTSYEASPARIAMYHEESNDLTLQLIEDSQARATEFDTFNAGSVQMRYATTLPSANQLMAFDADGSPVGQVVWVVAGTDDTLLVRRAASGATPTPEPTSLAAAVLAGSLLLRRQPKSKARS